MLNRVTLVGRLTRDPELKFTQNQRAVCSFSIAVNRNYINNSTGEREADFINIVVWGKTAENVSKYISKGSLIGIDGRIQTRNYENPQGQRIYVTEVVADNVAFLESRSNNENRQHVADFERPMNYSNNTTSNNASFDTEKDPFADFGNSVDISDDDLPF